MDLPEEILVDIYSRLPTNSVGKCRTLSKFWNTHLSTPNFIKKHLIHRKQTIQQQNIALFTQGAQLVIITSPTKSDEFFNSVSFTDECFNVLGSCNGLLLLNGIKKLLLVNPITFKQVTVQLFCPRPETKDWYYTYYGFGYDSYSDDYKVVQLSSYMSNETLVDIYSVKNGIWKSLDGCYPFGGLVPSEYNYEGGAFLDGALHWLICSKERYRCCIAAFDLATEVFREIPLPKEYVRQPESVASFPGTDLKLPRTNRVFVVGGFLLIVDNFRNGISEIWIMKEYGVAESWVKFRVHGNWRSIVAMLCFVGDGELLFLTNSFYILALDLKTGIVRRVVLGEGDTWFHHGMAFVDSLLSPESFVEDGVNGC